MSLLDYAALRAAPLQTSPYDYLIVPHFVRRAAFGGLVKDFPPIAKPGSFPPSELEIRGQFARLLQEMESEPFAQAIEEKFAIALKTRGRLVTVRGQCAKHNGKIHTDSSNKLITVLLYLNHKWDEAGGKLRVLRDGRNLDNMVEEIPPHEGTLFVFRRSERSWHGHPPFVGVRRVVQLNWLADARTAQLQRYRHRLSAWAKALGGRLRASHARESAA